MYNIWVKDLIKTGKSASRSNLRSEKEARLAAKKIRAGWGRHPEDVLVSISAIEQGVEVPICSYRGDVDIDIWSLLDDIDVDELSVSEKSRLLRMVGKIKEGGEQNE